MAKTKVAKGAAKSAKNAAKSASKAGDAVSAVKDSPYVQRLLEDDELRDTIVQAYDSAHAAYERLSHSKKPANKIFNDKKLQADIQTAATALRDATVALKDAPVKKKAKKKGGLGKKLLVLAVGAGAALALSEGLRKKVLDALFGAEEEFEYTSPTAAPSPAPAG